jgi:glycine/sarcosine N-methyltransferase
MMTIREAYDYLIRRLPIEKLPITWDTTGYTSEVFNRWVSDATFKGWTGDRPTGEEARVITSLLQVQPGHSLLDVACGYGRHDLLLAGKYNLKVTGIDISPGLITTARRLAAEQKLEIVFEVKHARGLSWNYEFDRAMIAGNSLSLFSPEDASIVLRNIYRALQPGGRLFADLDNKSYNCRYGISDTNWHTQPGGLTLQEIYFHNDTSVEVCRDLTFRTDAEGVEEFVIYKRIYSPDEIVHLFSGCGFRVSHVYGDWDLSSLETNSPKMLLVGSKE